MRFKITSNGADKDFLDLIPDTLHSGRCLFLQKLREVILLHCHKIGSQNCQNRIYKKIHQGTRQ